MLAGIVYYRRLYHRRAEGFEGVCTGSARRERASAEPRARGVRTGCRPSYDCGLSTEIAIEIPENNRQRLDFFRFGIETDQRPTRTDQRQNRVTRLLTRPLPELTRLQVRVPVHVPVVY